MHAQQDGQAGKAGAALMDCGMSSRQDMAAPTFADKPWPEKVTWLAHAWSLSEPTMPAVGPNLTEFFAPSNLKWVP